MSAMYQIDFFQLKKYIVFFCEILVLLLVGCNRNAISLSDADSKRNEIISAQILVHVAQEDATAIPDELLYYPPFERWIPYFTIEQQVNEAISGYIPPIKKYIFADASPMEIFEPGASSAEAERGRMKWGDLEGVSMKIVEAARGLGDKILWSAVVFDGNFVSESVEILAWMPGHDEKPIVRQLIKVVDDGIYQINFPHFQKVQVSVAENEDIPKVPGWIRLVSIDDAKDVIWMRQGTDKIATEWLITGRKYDVHLIPNLRARNQIKCTAYRLEPIYLDHLVNEPLIINLKTNQYILEEIEP